MKTKLKELKYNDKSIKDDFHQMVLFDKDYRLIKYDVIIKYAEDYVIGQKEINVYSKNNSLVGKALHVAIDKACDDAADLETHCPLITFGEDEYIPDAVAFEEPETKDLPKEPEVEHTEPTIHFDKKVFESGLSFREAYMRMVEGKKVSRPCFMGWWFMNHESKVVIHDRYGNELKEGDITNTVTNTLANDWEVIE